jgi:predicted CXXCH cytochrome family protein
VLVLVFLTLLLALLVFSEENQPHAFKSCSSCHVFTNPSGDRAHELTEPVTFLCKRCHERSLSEGYMHPVNIKPVDVVVPQDMPLSRYRQIVCTTCHDVHADYFTPYGTRSHFLRRQESGKAFCKICHDNLDALSRGHTASLGEAHFRSQNVVTDPSQHIDAMSMNCLTCHDGTYGSSVSSQAGIWKHEQGSLRHDQSSHPIGIDYEAARAQRGSKTDLRPMLSVDRRIRFFLGKVGCGSCHDPYSTSYKKLVISDENSKLCFSCHIV